MPLPTDFDHATARIVLVRGLLGTLMGCLPGIGLICWKGQALNGDPFLMTLLQTGCLGGALIGVGSGAAGRLVAVIRTRGNALGRMEATRDYVAPEPPPEIPSITKHRVRVSERTRGNRRHSSGEHLQTEQAPREEEAHVPRANSGSSYTEFQ